MNKLEHAKEGAHTPDGYNIGMNCGAIAIKTVMHFHCYVIPLYKGDMHGPQGGVRH
ncbi:HIT family protein [Phaeocystidibacter luteus]|uniref:HIT family protein n=1 Tax=Phaeocystidibacter luteus TaxID=911197 RepID=UPI003899D1BF